MIWIGALFGWIAGWFLGWCYGWNKAMAELVLARAVIEAARNCKKGVAELGGETGKRLMKMLYDALSAYDAHRKANS